MSDTAARAAETLEELRAELAHADALITEQQNRIHFLEHLVADLTAALSAHKGPRERPSAVVGLHWAVMAGAACGVGGSSRRGREGFTVER
jgi:hypothetical protein